MVDSRKHTENRRVAAVLDEMAKELTAGGVNPFRIAAYQTAASTVWPLPVPISEILISRGRAGLESLPGIGESLSQSIQGILNSGRLPKLDALREQRVRDWTLASLPGVGAALADRIRETLGSDSLHEVYAAAFDGRLRAVPGVGNKRLQAIRECLSLRLGNSAGRHRRNRTQRSREPRISTLLDIDREYPDRAAKRTLPTIAPRRFNPTGAAWLPILHTVRDGREFCAMFSNTARAHESGMTSDGVVIPVRQVNGRSLRPNAVNCAALVSSAAANRSVLSCSRTARTFACCRV